MQITLAGDVRELTHTEGAPVPSLSTGRPLRAVELTLVTRGDDMYDEVSGELRQAQRDIPLKSPDGTAWLVKNWSTMQVDGSASWEFTVELVEKEQLEVSRVEFLDRIVDIDFYAEESDRHVGYLLMQVETKVAAEDVQSLVDQLWGTDDGNGFFEFRRANVDEQPLRVRFGRVLWQAEDDGGRRFSLVFVRPPTEDDDPKVDDGDLINEPELSNLGRIAIAERARLRALIEELTTAGVLDPAAVERINQRATEAWRLEASETLAESRRIEQFRVGT